MKGRASWSRAATAGYGPSRPPARLRAGPGPGTRKAPMNTSEIAAIISGTTSLMAALINLIASIRGR